MSFDPEKVERETWRETIPKRYDRDRLHALYVRAEQFDTLLSLYRAELRKSDGWVSVENSEALQALERQDELYVDQMDIGRFSIPVMVWDEDESDYFQAEYDFRENVWIDGPTGTILTGVTHHRFLPSPPIPSAKTKER